jgi:hypothetical protein
MSATVNWIIRNGITLHLQDATIIDPTAVPLALSVRVNDNER